MPGSYRVDVTARLPFNPNRMKSKQTGKRAGNGGDKPPASVLDQSGSNAPMTVSQLATKIDHAIKMGIEGSVTVIGEISSLSHRTHYYFSLKDDRSLIGAVVFASSAKRMQYVPKHGDSVIAKGRVEYYAPSGRVSLIITSLTPVGQGALEEQLKLRLEKLRLDGWFDQEKKKALPFFPRCVAVVTSKDGAAVADVINTFAKRCPGIELMVVDVRVQGDQARGQISHAISQLNSNADHLGVDAIILTRGGGSLEDLWAFNELEVAQAIYSSQLPIVAAIGHETDTTIAELVADERCATPTQAAMRLSPDRVALYEQLGSIKSRLDRTLQSELRYERQRLDTIVASRALAGASQLIGMYRDRLDAQLDQLDGRIQTYLSQKRTRLDQLAIRLTRHQPAAAHARRQERLKQVSDRLDRVMNRAIEVRREELFSISRELHAIGPAQVIARGYSVSAKADGSLVRSIDDLTTGEIMMTTLADGKLRSQVIGDEQPQCQSGHQSSPLGPASKAPPRGSKRKLGKQDRANPDQMGLFGENPS